MSQFRRVTLQELASPSRSEGPVPSTRFGAGLRRRLADTLAVLRRLRTERATAQALASLGERQLKDIGVDRAAIPRVARAAAWSQLTAAGLDRIGTADRHRRF